MNEKIRDRQVIYTNISGMKLLQDIFFEEWIEHLKSTGREAQATKELEARKLIIK